MIYFNLKQKPILLTLILCFLSVFLFSQKLIFNNIKSINLTNQSVIKNSDGIKGYFFIHEKDTIDDSANTYLLSITDKNLQIFHEINIKVSQESYILETTSNGSEIVLSFLDFKTKTFEYQIYDLSGLKKFAYNRKISRKDFKQYSKSILKESDEDDFKSFYSVDTLGFIYKSMQTGKDLNSVKVDFYGTKENKQWTYEPVIKGSYFFWDYLGVHKNIVYLYIYSFKGSVYLDKPEVFIAGLDINTGKEIFKKPAEGKYKIVAKGIKTLNDGEGYLYGTYYNKGANLAKDKADGLALWKITTDVNIIDEKYSSWENSLGKFLTIKNNGKISTSLVKVIQK
jgi:hypothetical protein